MTSIELGEFELTMSPGEKRKLKLFALMSDGTRVEITGSNEIKYKTTSSYASVNTLGEVKLSSTTKKGIMITITATYKNKSEICEITVVNN